MLFLSPPGTPPRLLRPHRCALAAALAAALPLAPSVQAQSPPAPPTPRSDAPPGQTATHADSAEELRRKLATIEEAIERRRRELRIPGCALVIVKDDRVIFLKGFGQRDAARRLPVTPDTLFGVASSTKGFTAMAAAMSQDEGKLSLDDPPGKFLPGFRLRDPAADAGVTLRDLLCHGTGLSEEAAMWAIFGGFSRQEVVHIAAGTEPTAPFRTKWQYSNAGILAVGDAIERAQGGVQFARFVTDRVLQPLGMSSSTFSSDEMRRAGNASVGHYLDMEVAGGARLAPPRVQKMQEVIAPAGGLNSTARDMAQWLRLMAGGGVYGGKRLVSEKSFGELLTPGVPVGGPHYTSTLCWYKVFWHGKPVFYNGGNHAGYQSAVSFMPGERLGYALLENVDQSELRPEAEGIIYGALVGPPPEPTKPRPEAVPSAIKPDTPGPPAYVAPLTPEQLRQRQIDALGGEAALRRHRHLTLRFTVEMPTAGYTGEGTMTRQAPNLLSERYRFRALGREFHTRHDAFDGTQARRWFTGFVEPVRKGEQRLSRAESDALAIEAAFTPLLDEERLFREVRITGLEKVDGKEEAYVVRKQPRAGGGPVTDYVSTRSFLLLRRDAPHRGSRTYGDYRTVEGVKVPFLCTLRQGGWGTAVLKVTEARLGGDAPPRSEFTSD